MFGPEHPVEQRWSDRIPSLSTTAKPRHNPAITTSCSSSTLLFLHVTVKHLIYSRVFGSCRCLSLAPCIFFFLDEKGVLSCPPQTWVSLKWTSKTVALVCAFTRFVDYVADACSMMFPLSLQSSAVQQRERKEGQTHADMPSFYDEQR